MAKEELQVGQAEKVLIKHHFDRFLPNGVVAVVVDDGGVGGHGFVAAHMNAVGHLQRGDGRAFVCGRPRLEPVARLGGERTAAYIAPVVQLHGHGDLDVAWGGFRPFLKLPLGDADVHVVADLFGADDLA
jgi:hypothetical protein